MTVASAGVDGAGVSSAPLPTDDTTNYDEASLAETSVPEETSATTSQLESHSDNDDSISETLFDSRFNGLNDEPVQESVPEEDTVLPPGTHTVGGFRVNINDDGTAKLYNCESNERYITVPEKIGGAVITTICSSAFSRSCNSAIEITLPDSVTLIGDNAFSNMQNLLNIHLGSGVKTIENSAFKDCILLQKIELPDSVTSLGAAFVNCKSLKTVKLSNNIETIESYTFDGCIRLESITIPDSVKEIKSHAFRNCSGLKNAYFGTGLTVIGNDAFEDCSSLSEITIPGNVMRVEDYAFAQCTSLHTATLEEGVFIIGGGAFGGCESLKSLFLPDSLIEIENGLFHSIRPEHQIPDDIQITYKGNLYSKEMISQLVTDING